MTMPLVIFGTSQIAELAHHYFTHDSDYRVVAFTVDRDYLRETEFCGLPVVPLDELPARFPPDAHHGFVALSYSKLNAIRRDKFLAMRALGYRLASYVSSRACVGQPDQIGENCFVLEDSVVQPFTTLGDNVTVWSWTHVGHHGRVGDHSFVSACCIAGNVSIGQQCFVGAGAIVRDNVIIGDRCVIGAGALVLADAEPDGVYMGSAAERSRVPSSRLRSL